jgi:rare lipoprotein A (peptidoglycan hydrolase)
MIATAVIRRPGALYAVPPGASSSAPALQLRAALGGNLGFRSIDGAFRLAFGVFACAAATLAVISYQQIKRDGPAIDSTRNETIAFRRAGRMGTTSLGNHQDSEPSAWNYPRTVPTVRFLNSGAAQGLAASSEAVPTGKPYIINGRRYVPTDNATYRAEGTASWYGPDFHGGKTANGERYDMNGISAAHRTMPLPSYARVTNMANGRSIIVRVNNRGPFVKNRIADLSIGAAKALDFYKKGTARVRVEYVSPAPKESGDSQMLLATLREGAPAPAPTDVVVAQASSK